MSEICVKHLNYIYKDNGTSFCALKDMNLTLQDGEFVSVIGHSGCGKTTFLRLVAGLLKPTGGDIWINGNKVQGPGTDRAIVFQQYSLFPWMKVKKQVLFGIRHSSRKCSGKEAGEIADEFLQKVGMKSAADKYPFQLSGGMQQRVAIARALAMDADILLLDEPFGAVDARRRAELQGLLANLWNSEKKRKNVIFVTHDIDEAILLSERIVFMRPGEVAEIIQIPFSYPREKEKMMESEKYREIKEHIWNLFYASGGTEYEACV